MVAPAAMANVRVPDRDPLSPRPPVSCHWADSASVEMLAGGMSVDSTITQNTSPPSLMWRTLAVELTVTCPADARARYRGLPAHNRR